MNWNLSIQIQLLYKPDVGSSLGNYSDFLLTVMAVSIVVLVVVSSLPTKK